MSGVRFSGPNNSTTFTTCCGSAVIEEKCCPSCGEDVEPYYADSGHRTRTARFNSAYAPHQRAERTTAHDKQK